MKNRLIQNSNGMTLIELLAVIVILAIIATIAIPSIQGIIQNQRDKAIISEFSNLLSSAKIVYADDSCGDDNICNYSSTNNEIDFSSTKFLTAKVDFSNGNAPDEIRIIVDISSSVFKGRNAPTYSALISQSGGFSEQDLLEALTK